MKDLAEYAWYIFLASLVLGIWVFPLIIAWIIIVLLILRYKPEWFNKK